MGTGPVAALVLTTSATSLRSSAKVVSRLACKTKWHANLHLSCSLISLSNYSKKEASVVKWNRKTSMKDPAVLVTACGSNSRSDTSKALGLRHLLCRARCPALFNTGDTVWMYHSSTPVPPLHASLAPSHLFSLPKLLDSMVLLSPLLLLPLQHSVVVAPQLSAPRSWPAEPAPEFPLLPPGLHRDHITHSHHGDILAVSSSRRSTTTQKQSTNRPMAKEN